MYSFIHWFIHSLFFFLYSWIPSILNVEEWQRTVLHVHLFHRNVSFISSFRETIMNFQGLFHLWYMGWSKSTDLISFFNIYIQFQRQKIKIQRNSTGVTSEGGTIGTSGSNSYNSVKLMRMEPKQKGFRLGSIRGNSSTRFHEHLNRG